MAEPEKKPDEPGVGDWKRHPDASPHAEEGRAVPVGGLILADGEIEMNVGRPTTTLKVRNTGDRPIQVGSHYHFFEVNRHLDFDRPKAFGQRLDIPATTAIRFEPGDEKEVTLVPMGGKQFCLGFANLVDGWTGDGPTPDFRPNYEAAVRRAKEQGFKSTES
ncbi:urease subunit beta [Paludisphaera soli]|uniref:urease subunit beta n=1 Tax=Paludisphaera soli TaxID=2712865 RepID=UPI0013ED2D34|nr:urease subunit beta [Paludisphaera soli]